MTFYRIQPAHRDAADLLDKTTWQSRNWSDAWSEPQYGVSVCDSIDSLVQYFRRAGGYVDDSMVIVELVGYRSYEQDEDHEAGAILVFPTRIVSVTPVSDDILNRIYA
jgi:hypothetical protein